MKKRPGSITMVVPTMMASVNKDVVVRVGDFEMVGIITCFTPTGIMFVANRISNGDNSYLGEEMKIDKGSCEVLEILRGRYSFEDTVFGDSEPLTPTDCAPETMIGLDTPAVNTIEEVYDKDDFWCINPYVRDGKKIGRNDKCPCGSGSKYKKCCIGKGK